MTGRELLEALQALDVEGSPVLDLPVVAVAGGLAFPIDDGAAVNAFEDETRPGLPTPRLVLS